MARSWQERGKDVGNPALTVEEGAASQQGESVKSPAGDLARLAQGNDGEEKLGVTRLVRDECVRDIIEISTEPYILSPATSFA